MVEMLVQCSTPQFGTSSGARQDANSSENEQDNGSPGEQGGSDGSRDEGTVIRNAMLRLQHASSERAPPTYSRIISTLLTNSRSIVSRQWNPSLSSESVDSVVEAVAVLTAVALRGEQARQCRDAVRGVRRQLEGIIVDSVWNRITAELPELIASGVVAAQGWGDIDPAAMVRPPRSEVQRALVPLTASEDRLVNLDSVKIEFSKPELDSLPFNAASGLRKMRSWVRVFLAYGGASQPIPAGSSGAAAGEAAMADTYSVVRKR